MSYQSFTPYVTHHPDITLPELADILQKQFSVNVTPSGMSRFLTRAGYTYKTLVTSKRYRVVVKRKRNFKFLYYPIPNA